MKTPLRLMLTHLLSQVMSSTDSTREDAMARLTVFLGPCLAFPYSIYNNGKYAGLGISTLRVIDLPEQVMHYAAYVTEKRIDGSFIVKNRWGESGVFVDANHTQEV